MRKPAVSSCPNARPPERFAAIARSTPAWVSGSASMRSNPTGSWSSGSNWVAPTQSRPTSASRSNASNFDRIRDRIASVSGSRLSKKLATTAPRCSRLAGVKGSESERARPAGDSTQAGSYCRRCEPRVCVHTPTRTPFIQRTKDEERGMKNPPTSRPGVWRLSEDDVFWPYRP